ncbi:MAG: sulfotransferase [Chthoniobacterales bacterium]|nr:sulfotransferase [Chthoniobacterales bacterium]
MSEILASYYSMKNQKRIIVVLGVYRSGTSALMKSLEVMGVRLPDPSEVRFNIFNEKGYWEDLDFFSFNLKLTQAAAVLEGRRREIMPLTEKEVDFLCEQGFFEKASQLLLEKLSGSEALGIKTSSFSILLPFWKKVFEKCNVKASFVIALRNPLNVVASIEAAQEIIGKQDHQKSFWIWISYMLSSLEQTEGYERVLVDYDELLKDPAREIERIAHACQLEMIDERLQTYCDDFIDRSLCHFHGEQDRFLEDGSCRAFAVEMYEKLYPVAKGVSDFQELKSSLEKWRAPFLLAEPLLVLVEKAEYEVKKIQATLQEREQIITSLHAQVNEQMHSLANCYTTVHQRNLQVAALMKEKAVISQRSG